MWSTMKVLLVDDTPHNQQLLESALTKWEYEVIMADSSTEAWQILQINTTLTVAIIKVKIPGETGIDLCDKIKKNPTFSNIHVILFGEVNSRQDVFSALNAGADDFLATPINLEELRDRLKTVEKSRINRKTKSLWEKYNRDQNTKEQEKSTNRSEEEKKLTDTANYTVNSSSKIIIKNNIVSGSAKRRASTIIANTVVQPREIQKTQTQTQTVTAPAKPRPVAPPSQPKRPEAPSVHLIAGPFKIKY
jgi:response regulator RpfG family c-di-GMP phosphodiesterase